LIALPTVPPPLFRKEMTNLVIKLGQLFFFGEIKPVAHDDKSLLLLFCRAEPRNRRILKIEASTREY
jgi:hypothetical protein